jgi:hypothetical protein
MDFITALRDNKVSAGCILLQDKFVAIDSDIAERWNCTSILEGKYLKSTWIAAVSTSPFYMSCRTVKYTAANIKIVNRQRSTL